MTVAVPLRDELAGADPAPLAVAPPSPDSIAMLCETPDMFGISSVTGPAVAVALLVDVCELARWGWRRSGACRAFSTAGLPAPGACTAVASRPVSLPGLSTDLRDVGGDVLQPSSR